jgi:ankyrin repeat protein
MEDFIEFCRLGDINSVKNIVVPNIDNYDFTNIQPLLFACISGNVDLVMLIIEYYDISTYTIDYLLTSTSIEGHTHIYKYIYVNYHISVFIDVNKHFTLACTYNNIDLARFLHEICSNFSMVDLNMCLHEAIRNDNIDMINLLLPHTSLNKYHFIKSCEKSSISIITYIYDKLLIKPHLGYNDCVCLKYAYSRNNYELATLLLSLCPSINMTCGNYFCFVTACKYGYVELMKLFNILVPQIPVDFINIGFREAIKCGCLKICKILVHKYKSQIDFRVSSEFYIRETAMLGYQKIFEKLLEWCPEIDISVFNHEPFRLACQYGHYGIVVYLLDNYTIPIDICDNYAFRYACKGGYLNIVNHLITLCPTMELTNYHAITRASKNGSYDIVKLLIDHNLHHINDVFYAACESGNLELVNFLKKYITTTINPECLIIACQYGYIDIVKFLYENGVPVDALQYRAFILAVKNNHIDIITFLFNITKYNDIYTLLESIYSIYTLNTVRLLFKLYNLDIYISYSHSILLNKLEWFNVDAGEDECSICYNTCTIVKTCCGHIFCRKCIGKWLYKNKNCPYCRVVIYISV